MVCRLYGLVLLLSVWDGCCCETAWYAVSTCWFCCYQYGMVAVMRRHGMPSLRVGSVGCGMVAVVRRHGCRLCGWLKRGDLFVMHGISNPSLYICCYILHNIVKFGFVSHNTVVETGLPGKFYVVGFCIHSYCSLE